MQQNQDGKSVANMLDTIVPEDGYFFKVTTTTASSTAAQKLKLSN